jgi:hypothetical protein
VLLGPFYRTALIFPIAKRLLWTIGRLLASVWIRSGTLSTHSCALRTTAAAIAPRHASSRAWTAQRRASGSGAACGYRRSRLIGSSLPGRSVIFPTGAGTRRPVNSSR